MKISIKVLILLLLTVAGYGGAFFITTFMAVHFPLAPDFIHMMSAKIPLAAFSTWGWVRYIISALIPAFIVACLAARVIKLNFILSVITVLLAAIVGELGLRLALNESLGVSAGEIFALAASLGFSIMVILAMMSFFD